jgi:uroporphyrinogen decarboxylase
MMNSRDLVDQLLSRNGRPERVGAFEHFWAETTLNWIEQGYPGERAAPKGEALPRGPGKVTVSHVNPSFLDEIETLTPVDPYRHFDFDLHPCGGSFDTDPLCGFEAILEETDEWVIKRNGAGATFKYWKHKSGTPEHIAFRMTGREVWEREYRPHLLRADRRRLETGSWKSSTLEEDRAERAWARAHNKWCKVGHAFVWETMRQSLGDVCMYESLVLDPGWIHDFNRVYTDFFKAHFALLFEELGPPDGIWIYEDLAYRNGLIASPAMLRRLFLPYYAELVDFFHGFDLPVVLHSCGDVTRALPLVVEAGFDAIQPLEVKAGCDPLALAGEYGDRLAFIGGLDVRILETNDRVVVEREVARLVQGMKALGARYIFHSDHSITPRVNYDSYRCALDAYRKYMMY